MIYLIGPYSSTTQEEYQYNMGRLMAYYTWLTYIYNAPIVCYPLMTHGFEHTDKIPEHTYLQRCTTLLEEHHPMCVFVPGWESSYGSREEFHLAHIKNMTMMFPVMSIPTMDEILSILNDIKHVNTLAQFGIDYLEQVKTTMESPT